MEHREVKERFKIDSCEVFAVTKGNSSLICNCEAVVKVSEISRTFRTLHGTEYVAKKKVYSIIVCQKPEHNLTFEELEKIERFDIDAILIGRYEREHFAIRDIDTFSFLKSSYGDDATSQNTYDIVNETVGGHTASVIYQEINVEDHNYNTIYVYFETDNHIYCVSFNDTEISPEIEEMISQTPNSEMDQDKFYGKLDKATENYLKQEQELYDDLIYDELSRNNEKQRDIRYYFF